MLKKISFMGAGSMAESIIAGILNRDFLTKEQIFVTNRNNQERLDTLQESYQIQVIKDKQEVITDADIVMLSMKPHDMEAAIGSIKQHIQPNQLIVSVVAGVSSDDISDLFGKEVPVIRAMPNTSVAIGASATAVSKGKHATEEHINAVIELFNTIGTVTVVNEADMHTVTGISGSGPAYIYYFVEAMEKAAVDAGLDKEVAKDLITQTVVGAGEMLKHSGQTAGELRKNITSPGGTTQSGLEALAFNDFQEAVIECVKSARERSIELGDKI